MYTTSAWRIYIYIHIYVLTLTLLHPSRSVESRIGLEKGFGLLAGKLLTLHGEYAERRKQYETILHITPEYGISSSL